ncbi:hypothetical protein GCM10020256_38840 [Streptomyces thermocoprophilus]
MGQAPGVDVELRYDDQGGVLVGEAHGLGHVDLHAVQVDRTVAVDHALGVAGRAGGVAHGGGGALVQLGPLVRVGLPGEQLLVLVDLGVRVREEGAVSGPGDDDVLDRLEVRQQRGEQGQQGAVGDDHAVGGVVDDPRELLGGQAQVEGVEHGAHGGDGEVRLDVLGVVPHEGGDAVVVADAQVVAEGVGQLGGAGADLGVGAAVRFPPSPVHVTTCEVPWMRDPWVRILEISSGTSCMVLCTASSKATLPTRR